MARDDGEVFKLLDVTVLRATDKAILVRVPELDDDEIWFPQSQVHDNSEVWKEGDVGMLVVTAWIAKQKNLM